VFALCHQVSVTALPPFSSPPPAEDEPLGAACDDEEDELLLLVGVLLAPEPVFLLELQAVSPSAAIATTLIAAS
jgi:hypothetical protein